MENNAQSIPNAVTLQRVDSGGTADEVSTYNTSTALQPNTWYHVAVTYDGTNLRMYLNGVLQHTAASSRSLANTAAALTVDNVASTGQPFNGRLDEVAVYTSALPQARIQAHYDAGRR
jgi:hypothetical protein